jgi:hypothetical protein
MSTSSNGTVTTSSKEHIPGKEKTIRHTKEVE